MLKHFLRNNSGSALVELALTAPVLMLMIVGAVELGRIAYCAIEVQSAARAGAAYGAENVAFAGQTSTIKQVAKNDVSNIVDLTFPTDPTVACVCETITASSDAPSYNPTSGTTSCGATVISNCKISNSTENQQPVEYVVVNTQATVPALISLSFPGWGINLPSSFTLKGYAQVRVLQN